MLMYLVVSNILTTISILLSSKFAVGETGQTLDQGSKGPGFDSLLGYLEYFEQSLSPAWGSRSNNLRQGGLAI